MSVADKSSGQVVSVEWAGWPEGVTSAVLQVAAALGTAKPPTHLTIVVPSPPHLKAHRDCLREALRGLIHSSVLEQPGVRVNLVFGGADSDRRQAINYLAGAPFVYGATIDLGAM
jgi:hypothetical protein